VWALADDIPRTTSSRRVKVEFHQGVRPAPFTLRIIGRTCSECPTKIAPSCCERARARHSRPARWATPTKTMKQDARWSTSTRSSRHMSKKRRAEPRDDRA